MHCILIIQINIGIVSKNYLIFSSDNHDHFYMLNSKFTHSYTFLPLKYEKYSLLNRAKTENFYNNSKILQAALK